MAEFRCIAWGNPHPINGLKCGIESASAFEKQEAEMAKITTMETLFLDEIRDLYDAEKQLTKALPEMAKAASSVQLRDAFAEHLEQTQAQVRRLEQIFEALGEKPTGKKCAAMTGLVKEGNEIVSASNETPVRDAGLIAAAQKVEHYEISGYGSARTHAGILGNDGAVRLLEETLFEEKEANERLTELARYVINDQAARSSEVSAKSAGGSARGEW
jgi:ferritin-like metal-binding protein YciE